MDNLQALEEAEDWTPEVNKLYRDNFLVDLSMSSSKITMVSGLRRESRREHLLATSDHGAALQRIYVNAEWACYAGQNYPRAAASSTARADGPGGEGRSGKGFY